MTQLFSEAAAELQQPNFLIQAEQNEFMLLRRMK